MRDVIFSDREDVSQVVDSIKFSWVKFILEQTGMDLEGCFPDDDSEERTLDQKSKLRSILKQNKILVIDDHDGGVKIYIDEDLIAEWKKPHFNIKQDLKQIDPKKKLYTEIHLDYSSVFDEENNGTE